MQPKTVIITGANGNLGSAVTSIFLNKGYKVIATVHNEEAKKDLPVHNQLHIEAVNLMDEAQAASFVQSAVDNYHKIDGGLLLVGGYAAGTIAATGSDDIKKQISLNFDTAYNVARPLLKYMIGNNYGRLVFIGSRPAIQAADGKESVAYGLSKSLLFTLAEYINEEAKGKNVTASVVVPSTLDTAANRKSMPGTDPEKWVKPQALGEVLEFIISDKASALRETVLKVYNNA